MELGKRKQEQSRASDFERGCPGNALPMLIKKSVIPDVFDPLHKRTLSFEGVSFLFRRHADVAAISLRDILEEGCAAVQGTSRREINIFRPIIVSDVA